MCRIVWFVAIGWEINPMNQGRVSLSSTWIDIQIREHQPLIMGIRNKAGIAFERG